jgi:hypothetical protein
MGGGLLFSEFSVDLACVGDSEGGEAVDLDVVLLVALPDELLVLVGALELARYGLEKLTHLSYIVYRSYLCCLG